MTITLTDHTVAIWREIQRARGLKLTGKPNQELARSVASALGVPLPPIPEPFAFQRALIAAAAAEVGVRESPAGSNRGPRVDEYQRADWLKGEGYAWCAAFVCWCVARAAGEKPSFTLPLTAGAWDFEQWARGKYGPVPGWRIIGDQEPIRTGDIVIFTFSHIGIAETDEISGTIETIEGNTNSAGSREGDGVYRKTRRRSQIRSALRYAPVT